MSAQHFTLNATYSATIVTAFFSTLITAIYSTFLSTHFTGISMFMHIDKYCESYDKFRIAYKYLILLENTTFTTDTGIVNMNKITCMNYYVYATINKNTLSHLSLYIILSIYKSIYIADSSANFKTFLPAI